MRYQPKPELIGTRLAVVKTKLKLGVFAITIRPSLLLLFCCALVLICYNAFIPIPLGFSPGYVSTWFLITCSTHECNENNIPHKPLMLTVREESATVSQRLGVPRTHIRS